MEQIITWMNGWLEHPAQLRGLVILLSAGSAAVVGVMLVQLLGTWFDPSRRRVKQVLEQKEPSRTMRNRPPLSDQLLLKLSTWVTPKQGKELSKISDQLIYIGYADPVALKVFFGMKFVSGAVGALIALFAMRLFPDWPLTKMMIAIGGSGFVGMLLPNMLLRKLCERQLARYQKGFADSLDLLLVCVEAGLGLNAAIQRVANELVISQPQLAEQYGMVNEDIRVGRDRIDALRNFATRTRLAEADSLVNMLAQSLKYGTSIAETLRIFTFELRDKRMQRAEEQAAMVGTQLIFPLVLCIFPSFFLVIIGPAVLGVMKALAE